MATEIRTEEGAITAEDGLKLYTKTWIPSIEPKARLVFLHGFSDHCNFYETLFVPLATAGIQVHSFDQRGWGRSAPTKWHHGRTGSTEQVMSDITLFLRSLPPAPPSQQLPLFLMGHSMGGAETLVYAATGPSDVLSTIRGFLAESPYVALHAASRPWKLTIAAGRLAAKVVPGLPRVYKLQASKLSRDPEVARRYEADPLCHDTGRLAGMAGMLDRAADLEEGRVVLADGKGEGGRTRLWIGHGTADEVCGFDEAKAMFDRVTAADKEWKTYEGWYHKLHMEPGEDKVTFANDVTKWILDRSGPLETLNTPERAKL